MIVFAALLAVASAGVVPALAPAAIVSTGSSAQTRTQDAYGNYAFAYKENHATGGTTRSESGNPAGVVGSYSLGVIDGRQRVVNYVADGLGFRASISTNEPGTAALPAAATSIASPYAPPVAPAPIAVAAAPVAVAAAAPVAVAAPIAAPAITHGYAAAAVPLGASYSSIVNHAAIAAPIAAPAIAKTVIAAAPAYAAPAYAAAAVPVGTSYSSVVNHGAIAAAPIAAIAAPAVTKTIIGAPALAAPLYGNGLLATKTLYG